MAGGQERILRRRIRTRPDHEEDHARDGAHRGEPDRQGAGAGAGGPVPYSDRITEVVRDLAAGRRRRRAARCSSRATRSARSRTSCIAADRGLCGGYNSSVIRAGRARAQGAAGRSGRDYALVLVGQEGRGLLPLPQLPHRRRRSPASATSRPTRTPAQVAAGGRSSRSRPARSTSCSSSTPASSRPARRRSCERHADAARPERPRDRRRRRRRRGRRRRRPSRELRVRARARTRSSTGCCPRYVEARVYAALLERGRVGARGPPAGDEGRDRQRRRPHHAASPGCMNRARQDAITTEIMEIVGGAEALRGGGALVNTDLLSDTIEAPPRGSLRRPHATAEPGATMTATANPETKPRTTELKDGRVVAIAGPVVDVEFPPDALPEINHALEMDVELEGETITITAEVAQQIGDGRVRVDLPEADRRPAPRHASCATLGHGITMPVGDGVLGHVFNVIGEPLDIARGRAHRHRRPLGDPPRPRRRSTSSSRRRRCSRPASRSSTCSSPTCRAARSACSAAPASARPSSSRR